jgi:hypothetical protein
MSLYDYQVGSVIKAYLRNMTTRATGLGRTEDQEMPEDLVIISREAFRTMLFERIGKQMTGRLRKREAGIVAGFAEELEKPPAGRTILPLPASHQNPTEP